MSNPPPLPPPHTGICIWCLGKFELDHPNAILCRVHRTRL
jgi:hypothetical protein